MVLHGPPAVLENALAALAGALSHLRAVCARVGTAFGLAGVLGTIPGAWLNHHVAAPVVLAGFGATVLVVALRMTRPLPAPREQQHAIAALVAGFAGGVATGFFGVGGGFLIVPALTVLLGLEMRAAVATSLLVIAVNALGALAAHAAYGTVVWLIGAEVAVAARRSARLAARHAHRPAHAAARIRGVSGRSRSRYPRTGDRRDSRITYASPDDAPSPAVRAMEES